MTLRRLPWVTFTIIGVSWIWQYFGLTTLVIPSWLEDERLVAVFILHPIMHTVKDVNDWSHLIKNTVFGLVAGTLVESWTMVRCRTRLGMLAVCYVSSLVASIMKWEFIGPNLQPAIDLSGMISAAIAVLLVYYRLFRHQIRLDGASWFGPLGIGFLSWFLIEPFYNAIFVPFKQTDTVNFHVIAFFVGAGLAYLLLRRSPANIPQQRN